LSHVKDAGDVKFSIAVFTFFMEITFYLYSTMFQMKLLLKSEGASSVTQALILSTILFMLYI